MKISLDESQRDLLYGEIGKDINTVELSKEELNSIVGGNLSWFLPHRLTTMALGEEDTLKIKFK